MAITQSYPVAPSPFKSTEGSSRILIVDDQPDMLEILKDILDDAGYEVISAKRGEEAISRVNSDLPDLILLDALMPGLTGFEVTRILKTNDLTRLIPIIMLTGLSDLEDKIHGIEEGVDDFLTKPFNRVELLTRVKSLIRVKLYTDELEKAETVIFSLALAVEAKDKYTEGHCSRLSQYGSVMAERIGLPPDMVKAVRRGGILHDIGKIAIQDSILLKPASLSTDEFAIIQRHPEIGERICQPLRSLHQVLPIIRHHHERWNGSGYPDGLAGESIPVTARIIMIVDMYDALTTQRPYRAELTQKQAFEIMREETAMELYDPALMDEFIDMICDTTKPKLT
jgi:putative two-component system response regulator